MATFMYFQCQEVYLIVVVIIFSNIIISLYFAVFEIKSLTQFLLHLVIQYRLLNICFFLFLICQKWFILFQCFCKYSSAQRTVEESVISIEIAYLHNCIIAYLHICIIAQLPNLHSCIIEKNKYNMFMFTLYVDIIQTFQL